MTRAARPAMHAHRSFPLAQTTPPTKGPTPPPGPVHPRPLHDPKAPPTEPAEVLGRHKNDGQKDHKGAR